MPDLLRAYGEMLERPDRGVTVVFCVLAAGVTALVLLFALGAAMGRVRRAWSRARSRGHSMSTPRSSTTSTSTNRTPASAGWGR
jgi:hypothetical protein